MKGSLEQQAKKLLQKLYLPPKIVIGFVALATGINVIAIVITHLLLY